MSKIQNFVCACVILAVSCISIFLSMYIHILAFLTFELPVSKAQSLRQKALESGSLSERLENLRVLGFRGPKPRKTCWAGSVYRGFPTVEGSMYKQMENSNHLKM